MIFLISGSGLARQRGSGPAFACCYPVDCLYSFYFDLPNEKIFTMKYYLIGVCDGTAKGAPVAGCCPNGAY